MLGYGELVSIDTKSFAAHFVYSRRLRAERPANIS
jgi:hypothetical protein